ncbi:MAG: D-sedoheptulose 7-phosphate isomerase [Bacteroidetes bacterium]|nr:MAG: D-sedoheptulose 7-phosphate isomerase [Bacteroidota bacterium]REK06552.1 MAG: D-sedoheptulose 7-phosphate isomerase [Bacteroidota bacterium]REK33318.1 MAG: D-sedoheptulose 7-phosphate isomerase [Bacteroidota bacterium]REK49718.1 MAG: D-sedoheptulose 7-phosphate isomerase [Bacteroidota bacterium]
MNRTEQIEKNLIEAQTSLDNFLKDKNNISRIASAAGIMIDSLGNGGKLISCGNGGSMCDAMHFAEELSGRFRDDRPALAAISISDPSHITCVANDYGVEFIFSRFIDAHGRPGDVLLAISTSGNSPNVVAAAESAKAKGMKIVGLTGKSGGALAEICDVEIRAPHSDYADRAQEIHIKVIHSLIHCIEAELKK